MEFEACVDFLDPVSVSSGADREADQGSEPVDSRRKVDTAEQPLHCHHVHKQLPLQAVALGDNNTYIVSFKDGSCAWSGGLPKGLHTTLDTIVNQENNIEFATMGRLCDNSNTYMQPGGGEVWSVRDSEGSTWLGEDCDKTLRSVWWGREHVDRVENVYFAPGSGWFALKRGVTARAHNLPHSLQQALDTNWDSLAGVDSLSIGHDGEWFVKYVDGCIQPSGVHPVLAHWLEEKGELTGAVQWVELGPHFTFVALFERYTLWYGSEELTSVLLS